MHPRGFKLLILTVIASMLVAALSGCSPARSQVDSSILPDFVQNSPVRVQQAYAYAMEHPEELEKYPCYCGCGAMGHKDNLDCYIEEISTDGTVAWDIHASGCGICVDITLDVMRLKADGWSSPDIRAYIDNTYSAFGPATDTPLPTS